MLRFERVYSGAVSGTSSKAKEKTATMRNTRHVAFFSTSVYYSLEFQQLPSVQDAQVESY